MNHMTVDSPDAPWHDEELPPREVEVCVSVTLSRTFTVMVTDYTLHPDEDGRPVEDFSQCNIKGAVSKQEVLPQELLPDWNLDEFECILE